VHNPDHIIHMENVYFYQNTTIYASKHPIGGYAGHSIYHFHPDAERRVYNNLFLMTHDGDYPLPFGDRQRPAADLVFDYNLHWNIRTGIGPSVDLQRIAREHPLSIANRNHCPDGWAAHSQFAPPRLRIAEPDPRTVNDYRLHPDSPAIAGGMVLPDDWPDPWRPADGSRPDIGALPAGEDNLWVGIHGRVRAGMLKITDIEPAAEVSRCPGRDPISS
jgi:hypothetical protein